MRHRIRMALHLIGFLAISLHASLVRSQDEAAETPKFDFAASAAEYDVSVGSDHVARELSPVELLKWSNPVRGTPAGTIFLWHHQGMPQAACCMYAKLSNPGGNYVADHELISLSTGLVEARLAGESVWQAKAPGIAWRPIEQGLTIAKTRPARLIQMRELAAKFTASIIKANKTEEELRLLRQPVYRYSETMDNDGAIFVFAQATDPEILLLLDGDPKSAEPTWRFAAARMTMVGCKLSYDEKQVWSARWHHQNNDDLHTYRIRDGIPLKAIDGK